MRQVLIRKNAQIRELSGSRITFRNKSENIEDGRFGDGDPGTAINDERVTKFVFPFEAKIMAGGTLDLDFSLPEPLAKAGISLLGAYWDGKQVTAYMRALSETSLFVKDTEDLLIGTLVQVTTMKQIEDAILGDQRAESGGQALQIKDNKPKRKPRRKT